MPTVNIYFRGLICHVGGVAEKDHAVLVNDAEHAPLVILAGSDGKPVEHPVSAGSEIRFEIDGRRVAAKAKVPPAGDFHRMVPRLKQLIDGDLHDDIKKKKHHTSAAAYVTYPGGDLRVHDVFPDAARYMLDGNPVGRMPAVARTTVLVFDSGNDPIRILENDKVLGVIPVGGCAIISNASIASTTDHWMANRTLLAHGSRLAQVHPDGPATEKPSQPMPCSWIEKELGAHGRKGETKGVNVECSNTGYP